MRRSALVLTLAVVILGGCEKPSAEMDRESQEAYAPAMQPELFMIDPAAEATAEAPLDAEPGVEDAPVVAAPAPPRTHRVVKGDSLFALARCYYDDARRWKDIYEANRDRLSSPDSLRIDQVLVIP